MIPVTCFVQDGQISASVESALRLDIDGFVQRAFHAPADIDWIVVASGSGFTGARPSTSVVASLQANRVLGQGERIALLKELSAICMRKTGRSAHEIVTSIRDPK